MIGALLIIWIVLTVLTNGIFFTARNLYNLAVQTSVVGIMATGMVLVIVARHIDLSVGSLMGFTGMVIAGARQEMRAREQVSWRWFAERAGTTCDVLKSEPLWGCGYRQAIYEAG